MILKSEVTELTANIIAEYIYVMCEPEGKQVLLFDCIVDFKGDINDMTLTYQNFLDSCAQARNYRSSE